MYVFNESERTALLGRRVPSPMLPHEKRRDVFSWLKSTYSKIPQRTLFLALNLAFIIFALFLISSKLRKFEKLISSLRRRK